LNEVVVIFLANSRISNTAPFFCCLLELVSHTFKEGDSYSMRKLVRNWIASKRSVTNAILDFC